MRRLLTGFAVALLTAVVPVLALAGNQEIADQIAGKLRHSGRMSDYKLSVKYQNGTAWLRGRVVSEEQMETALRLTFQVPEVARVVNEISVVSSDSEVGDIQSSANSSRGTQHPQRRTLAQRLETVLLGSADEDRSSAVHPERSYADGSAVEQTAGEEPQEMPKLAPSFQRSKPAMTKSRAPARMAMQQPLVREPMPGPNGGPVPMYHSAMAQPGTQPARYDQPCLPNYAWPSYAAYPNYAAVTYPKQYSPTAWPYIGPFYPYPQVPLGWRKVTLEWDDGWWFLDFKDQPASCWHR